LIRDKECGFASRAKSDKQASGPESLHPGHPVGATGVSQHVLAAMQLTGTAGDMQLASPRRAAVQNIGGVGIANYVSILEAV
jgi:acetyl-CoA acetyltransferase